jgi:hypothetical protein
MSQRFLCHIKKLMAMEGEPTTLDDALGYWQWEERTSELRVGLEIVIARPLGEKQVQNAAQTYDRASLEFFQAFDELVLTRVFASQVFGDNVG